MGLVGGGAGVGVVRVVVVRGREWVEGHTAAGAKDHGFALTYTCSRGQCCKIRPRDVTRHIAFRLPSSVARSPKVTTHSAVSTMLRGFHWSLLPYIAAYTYNPCT